MFVRRVGVEVEAHERVMNFRTLKPINNVRRRQQLLVNGNDEQDFET